MRVRGWKGWGGLGLKGVGGWEGRVYGLNGIDDMITSRTL